MQRRLLEFLWVATFLWVLLACFRPLQFPDLWWQLDEGIQIVTSHHLTATVRTFAYPEEPAVNEYLLFECGIAFLYQAGGIFALWLGLGLLAAAPFFILAGLLFQTRERLAFGLWLCFLLIFLLSYVRIQQRPEMAANLCEIALGLVLIRQISSVLSLGKLCVVAMIFAVWANVHGSFIVGFWMLVLFFAARLLLFAERKVTFIGAIKALIAATMGTALNPDGTDRFFLPFQLIRAAWAHELTPEMTAVPGLIVIMAIPVLIAALYLLQPFRKQFFWLVLLLLSSLALNLTSIRYVNLVSIALWLILAQRLLLPPRWFSPYKRGTSLPLVLASTTALVAVILLLILETSRFRGAIPYVHLDEIGEAAFKKLTTETQGRSVAILADAWVGSLGCSPATPNFFPLIHSGISRFQPDSLRYAYLIERDPRAFHYTLNKLEADYLIINERNLQWGIPMSSHPDWTCQAAGPGYVVFGRGLPALAQLKASDPIQQLCRLDQLSPEEQAKALEEVRKARIPSAGWDFLIDWAQAQSPDKLQELLPYFSEETKGGKISAVLLGALGKFNEARTALKKDPDPGEGIEAWLNLQEGKMSGKSVLQGDEVSTYQVEASASTDLSPRNRDKQLDREWFEKFTLSLNENLKKLRQAPSLVSP